MDLTRGRKASDVWVVATFPVHGSDELVLVTDRGQLIRCPVRGIRIAGRSTRGVRVFHVDEDERVVSVARLDDVEAAEDDDAEYGAENGGAEAADDIAEDIAEDRADDGDAGADAGAPVEPEESA